MALGIFCQVVLRCARMLLSRVKDFGLCLVD